jgi:hypothetical protein
MIHIRISSMSSVAALEGGPRPSAKKHQFDTIFAALVLHDTRTGAILEPAEFRTGEVVEPYSNVKK